MIETIDMTPKSSLRGHASVAVFPLTISFNFKFYLPYFAERHSSGPTMQYAHCDCQVYFIQVP